MGVLQRLFRNSTLAMDAVVCTADEQNIHLSPAQLHRAQGCHYLPHTYARRASIGHSGQAPWQPPAAHAFPLLEAEPALAAHVSQATLPWSWSVGAGSSLADQVSSLSSLTKLTLGNRDSPLGAAGMLDALRQLSALQSLHCLADVMQTLLVSSVPSSWPLLARLQIIRPERESGYDENNVIWSLVEQQCPQLQALAMNKAVPLCLTALTSLTCTRWEPRDTDSFQCSQLGHLHVRGAANLNLLPSMLTSLSLDSIWQSPVTLDLQDQHMRSQQSLVHICFTSWLEDLSDIRGLVPASHPVLTGVTSVELTIDPGAFKPPDMDGIMYGHYFRHLCAWFPYLQRLHIHLQNKYTMFDGLVARDVLISAAWLPAHCRLLVTHKLTKSQVRVVKCPSDCLSLSPSSHPAHEWLDNM